MEPGSTSVSTHGLGYLFTALRRQGLITDELVLQLTTFLRSLDLFLELIVLIRAPITKEALPFAALFGIEIVSAVFDKISEMMVRD